MAFVCAHAVFHPCRTHVAALLLRMSGRRYDHELPITARQTVLLTRHGFLTRSRQPLLSASETMMGEGRLEVAFIGLMGPITILYGRSIT